MPFSSRSSDTFFTDRPRRGNSLRNIAIVAGAILALGGVVTAYGLRRGDTGVEPSTGAAEQIALAGKLVETNQADKAIVLLDQVAAGEKGGQLPEAATLLRLEALEDANMDARLAAEANAFLERFPNSARKDEVELMALSGKVASAGLTEPGLLQTVESFIRKNPERPGVAKLQLALARQEIGVGDEPAARRRLLMALKDPSLKGNDRKAAMDLLGAVNLSALFRGDSQTGADTTYTVASGDSIWLIAKRHEITQELVLRANGIDDPRRLRVGQTLRIPNTDFSLHCDVAKNELVVYNHGEFFKRYHVRTGREAGATPTGEFKILNKKTEPTWRPGDGRVYLPGDPNNELGTRWMAFEGDILGIHGTIHPETVGHYASNGCIGLTTPEVEELFELVLEGTPLTITGQQDLAANKVIPAPQVPDPLTKREIAGL
ncbi:MAG: L,D-transpeptidase family protein [Sumerlaeia bacterium]